MTVRSAGAFTAKVYSLGRVPAAEPVQGHAEVGSTARALAEGAVKGVGTRGLRACGNAQNGNGQHEEQGGSSRSCHEICPRCKRGEKEGLAPGE